MKGILSFKHCPGIKNIIGPVQIIMRTCPACSEEVEFFSDETKASCPKCGRTLHQEATSSCVSWCKYAEKCIEDLEKRRLLPHPRAEELKRLIKIRQEALEQI